ncbi:MAG: redoxin domain-containing protein, partial [Bryobacteraceae bacterium]
MRWLAPMALRLIFDLPDLAGTRHSAVELDGARAAVFVFLAPGCSLSERSAPELERLHAAHASRGVVFFGVYSGRDEARFDLPFPVLADSEQTLARQLGATVTPEAVVWRRGRVAYRGRIDDRAIEVGKTRAPSRFDLREALEEVAGGGAVVERRTKAVGCAIPLFKKASTAGVTFAADVAPILHRHCAGCHRPGQSGPFSLLTYADARARAATIAGVAARRVMPPWKPEPVGPRLAGERRLSEREIGVLREWAEG